MSTFQTAHRLSPALESALQRVQFAARDSVERTIQSLGLAALSSKDVFQRDTVLSAQTDLNRKSAQLQLAFNEALEQRVRSETAPLPAGPAGGASINGDWQALTLVEEREVENQVRAERWGMEVAQACEWELRELQPYIGALLGPGRAGAEARNPLRPELVCLAVIRGVDEVSDRPEVRHAIQAEFVRSLKELLRPAYAAIVSDLQAAGARPAELAVRSSPEGRGAAPGADPGLSISTRAGDLAAPSTRSGAPARNSGGRGTPIGSVDPQVMDLIRRLAFNPPGYTESGNDWVGSTAGRFELPNLIHAHRDALRQAATGQLDHMVIDVVGALFDQILSDPKVPPQMARQIGRLQLPVLRAALGDASFFSQRKHPVRRFVNRIAQLGAGFDDFGEAGARAVLDKVKALVQDVVRGDFDQIELYEQKLAALEQFVADQGRQALDERGNAAALLGAKEDEMRLRVLYAQQLANELAGLEAPQFLRDFISHVWSHVLLRTAAEGTPERVAQVRQVARDLFMSVQPKTGPQARKAFLAELPALMKALGAGLDLIAWPEHSRKAFFAQLLPAHSESLKAPTAMLLDHNLLQRKLEGVLQTPPPSAEQLRAAPAALPQLAQMMDTGAIAPRFTPEDAKRIGLVDESAVDWNGHVDIVLDEPPVAAVDIAIDGLPPPAADEPAAPLDGSELAAHLRIGAPYRMHLQGGWQKVRLSHVSAGRSFYVFHHGSQELQTISLTRRMLLRLCETGRLRAYENAELMDRAAARTARARREASTIRIPD